MLGRVLRGAFFGVGRWVGRCMVDLNGLVPFGWESRDVGMMCMFSLTGKGR